jgi:hypothetical protein
MARKKTAKPAAESDKPAEILPAVLDVGRKKEEEEVFESLEDHLEEDEETADDEDNPQTEDDPWASQMRMKRKQGASERKYSLWS